MSARDRKMSSREEYKLRVLRDRAYQKQNGLCYWCKQPMKRKGPDTDPRRLTGDHLIPVHRGGQTIAGNIVAACRECNGGRHPEMNRMKAGGGLVVTVGDDAPRSPFEILVAL